MALQLQHIFTSIRMGCGEKQRQPLVDGITCPICKITQRRYARTQNLATERLGKFA
jgi:hypothetical protein